MQPGNANLPIGAKGEVARLLPYTFTYTYSRAEREAAPRQAL